MPSLAYVLHRWNWSESSLILDLLTRDQGRLVVAAKGAKRPTSQLRSVLLPFQRLQVLIGRPPTSSDEAGSLDDVPDAPAPREVQTLRSAEWAGGPAMPTGAALFSGFYLNELLMRMTARQDPSPDLFDGYVATLAAMRSDDDAAVQAALRAFELLLLRTSGLLPDLSCGTVTQQPVQVERAYALLPVTGVVAADATAPGSMSGETLVTAEAALRHGSLVALQQACRGALPAWRGALRSLIYHHLGSPLLRTRQVLQDVQGLAAAEPAPVADPRRRGASAAP